MRQRQGRSGLLLLQLLPPAAPPGPSESGRRSSVWKGEWSCLAPVAKQAVGSMHIHYSGSGRESSTSVWLLSVPPARLLMGWWVVHRERRGGGGGVEARLGEEGQLGQPKPPPVGSIHLFFFFFFCKGKCGGFVYFDQGRW
jgi:hypothetical protein